jgi:hypothetical protein
VSLFNGFQLLASRTNAASLGSDLPVHDIPDVGGWTRTLGLT